MRVLLQRVLDADLKVGREEVSSIKNGLLLFIGIHHDDIYEDVEYLAEKCINLRVFNDADGKMNLSVKDIDGDVLAVSQFTLYGNTKKGRRPSFEEAAKPSEALSIYEMFVEKLKESGLKVKTGVFGEHMRINLTNDGPVTFILESK